MVGGQQSTRSLLHLAELFRLADRAGPAGRPAARGRAHEDRARAARHRWLSAAMRDFSQSHEWLSINTATRAQAVAARSHHRRMRAARHPRDLAVARPGGRGRAASGGQRSCATPASRCRATAAAASFRPPTRPAWPRRSTTTAAPSTRRCTLNAPCLVLVVGSLPGALEGKPAHRDIARARAEVRDGIAATLRVRAHGRHAAGDRAAAPDAGRRARLHQHARAGARPLRRARRPDAAARSASRSTCTTCGGTRSSRSRSRAPAASACSPSTSATG